MTTDEMRREMMLGKNEDLFMSLTGSTAFYDKGGSNYGHGTVLSANLTPRGDLMLILDRGIGRGKPEVVMQKQVYGLRRVLRPAGLAR